MNFLICFQKNDKEFINVLHKEFGDDIEITLIEGLDGKEFLSALVNIAKITIEFINKHMKNEKTKRFIKTRHGDIYFQNYTAEEIVMVLEALKNEK